MKEETSPTVILDGQLEDYHSSRLLSFDCEVQASGYPDDEALFDTALCYLELIFDGFIQSGQFWNKTARDIVDRLLYHNEWNKYEIELEHKSGETSATYQEVTIHHLRALSERQLLAMEDTGWTQSEAYRMAQFLHALIEEASANYAAVEDLLEIAIPAVYLAPYSDEDRGVPF